jgi:PII interaction protein X
MNNETYINHPTFGLLYRLSKLEDNRELFTTLYAQRLFFIVTITKNEVIFDPVTRSDARLMLEARLRKLRHYGPLSEYEQLNKVLKGTF